MSPTSKFLGVFDGVAPEQIRGEQGAHEVAWWRSLDGATWRGYFSGASSPSGLWTELTPISSLQGASKLITARHHYVVETDIPQNAEAEFNAWYETEHLPGLARVPGTIIARRFMRKTGGPRYLACYDLESPLVMERPEWLAIRQTPWSARMRPMFMNTVRTLYVLGVEPTK